METLLEAKRHLRGFILAWTARSPDHLLLTTYFRSLELILLASKGFGERHAVQNYVEPIIIACIRDIVDAQLSTVQVVELQNYVTKTIARLSEINSSSPNIIFPELAQLVQAILHAANSTSESERLTGKLKVKRFLNYLRRRLIL